MVRAVVISHVIVATSRFSYREVNLAVRRQALWQALLNDAAHLWRAQSSWSLHWASAGYRCWRLDTVVVTLSWTRSDWFGLSLPGDGQYVFPLIRSSLWAAPRWHNSAVREHSILGLTERKQWSNRVFPPCDPIYFLTTWRCWSRDVYFEYRMPIQAHCVLVRWQSVDLLAFSTLIRSCWHAARPSWWTFMEWCTIISVPTSAVLPNYTNLGVEERSQAAAECHTDAISFSTMVLVRLFDSDERGVVRFTSMTSKWVRMVAGYSSRFRLTLGVASFITALHLSASVGLLIPSLCIWRSVAEQKSTDRLLMMCTVVLHTDSPMDVHKTWLEHWLRHRSEMQVVCLVQIECMTLRLSPGPYPLLTGAA